MSLCWVYVDPYQQILQPLTTSLVDQHPGSSKMMEQVTNPVFAAATAGKLLSPVLPASALIAPNTDTKTGWGYIPVSALQFKPDTSKHFHIFVGDLCPDLEPNQLRDAFSPFGEISDYKIIQDPQTLKSKGYGFVTYIRKEDAEKAILHMNGQWVGTRAIRTNWAMRKLSVSGGSRDGGKALSYEDVFNQTHAGNCTVYCGGVMTGLTEELMLKTFHGFGPIQEIRIFKEKGFAFIRFNTKEVATQAILGRHLADINGHIVKCSWGKKSDEPSDTNSTSGPMAAQIMSPPPTLIAHPQQQQYYVNMPHSAVSAPSSPYTHLGYYACPEGYQKVQDYGYTLPLLQQQGFGLNYSALSIAHQLPQMAATPHSTQYPVLAQQPNLLYAVQHV